MLNKVLKAISPFITNKNAFIGIFAVFGLIYIFSDSYPSEPNEVAEKYFMASLYEDYEEAEKYVTGTPESIKKQAPVIYVNFLNGWYGEARDGIKITSKINKEDDYKAEVDIFIKNTKSENLKNFDFEKIHFSKRNRLNLKKIDDKWKIAYISENYGYVKYYYDEDKE